MTDEVWTDEKEMQCPILHIGQSAKADTEGSQMLPFLRRTLPLFEASMAEAQYRQFPMAGQSAPAMEARTNSTFGLSEAFTKRCFDASVTVSDLSICPDFYGADHAAILYT